ncbi:MAG TPA: glucosaminidase domain-containing protein [Candidatus Mediterraneibacter pullicola]|uniref:Glucosaminidase domain-containing protein n=1 Tax=Candidatus Mediterraneibacter pullicola TaxID=2838682 RepID=A0A9D2HA26_9FIRM|nr:glucosaminidase domain-containing protein [Candidatus Mediterraneibacter pullicola]
MIRKSKLLICTLVMSMMVTVLPGMTSYAAEAEGETEASATELQDENSQRLEEVTAMDEEGNIYEIADTDGTVSEEVSEETAEEETNGIALFSARSVENKVVNFNTKGNATTNYTDSNGKSGYTNGAYGADAAYLGTTSDGNIKFMLAGVTGTVSASDVELVDYSTVADRVSYYKVSGGRLIHYISQNLNNAPSSTIDNGPAPSYLSQDTKYYSYDGHYFYTDYGVMLSDYQSGCNGDSAVNSGNRFENYFQFLDMNSSTGYSADELNTILNDTLQSKGKNSSSKLWDAGNLFVKYQNTYGVNALLSVGIAINESGWGTSSISQNKNNLFGLNAQDSNVGNASSYYSVESCIIDFMKNWMAGGYLNDASWKNFGEFLGNKGEGINVKYASDPYWGEKAAAHAWTLDENGDSRDYTGVVIEPPADVPSTDEPTTDEPVTDVPSTDEPTTDEPVTDVPSTDEPVTDEPVTDVPSTDEPVTDEPVTDVPSTDGPSVGSGSDGTTAGSGSDDTVTGDAGSNSGAQTETQKTVSDSAGKVTVSGKLSGGAGVTVDMVAPNTDAYTRYVSAECLKGKTILGVYDITLTGELEGEAQLTFHVDAKYNGKDVIILHYADDGTYETYNAKVENGQVTISVKGFSPYVIALNESGSGAGAAAPKTGDSSNIMLWIALLGISVAAAAGALIRRRVSR